MRMMFCCDCDNTMRRDYQFAETLRYKFRQAQTLFALLRKLYYKSEKG